MTIEYCAGVPDDDCPTALEALAQIVGGASRVRAAVAFVTSSGVELLEALLDAHPGLTLELFARGAPITDPSSLERLAERGTSVSVVVGARARAFHPKLWIAEHSDALHVLSGSGNLTSGGLRDNDEQFELLRVPAIDSTRTDEQERRFARLTASAVPLEVVRSSPYWSLWKKQLTERRKIADHEQQLNRILERAADAQVAVETLYADLVDFYTRTKDEVEIPTPRRCTALRRLLFQTCDR